MQIKSIGIDLGKTTFHLVALGSSFQVVVRKKFSRQQTVVVHSQSALVVDGDGGRCGVALSGPSPARAGARGTTDSGAVCATVREVEQERLLRCGSDCRGGGAREHAFRAIKTEGQLDLQALHRVRSGWSQDAPASSIRFRLSCWSAGSAFGKGRPACAGKCRRFWRTPTRD